jgi:hypothetical protein
VPDDLHDVVDNLAGMWTVKKCLSESPSTDLWSIETMIPGAKGKDSATESLAIGKPWGSFIRYECMITATLTVLIDIVGLLLFGSGTLGCLLVRVRTISFWTEMLSFARSSALKVNTWSFWQSVASTEW